MNWDKKDQLRHSAVCIFPRLTAGRTGEVLRILQQLQELGYDGCIASMSADAIMQGWAKAGWIRISPNCAECRLTADGEEQLARFQEEDLLWRQGQPQDLKLPKRLKAGEPATNLRRLRQVIGNRTLDAVHDPYTRVPSLENLLKLIELGAIISPRLRILGSELGKTDREILAGFIRDVNVEKHSNWQVGIYTGPERPHRRFLICTDGTIITCGLSLNNVNKDEALEIVPSTSDLADHDHQWFEEKWKLAAPA